MPQFTRQGSRPLTAAAYERAASKAQDLAESVTLAARRAHGEGATRSGLRRRAPGTCMSTAG